MQNRIEKMQSFIDWMDFTIQSVHKITNEQFMNILEKM